MDRAAIEAVIPQRPPFLLVDEVLDLVPGELCRARRLVRADDPWSEGSPPDEAVMPGTLVVEALAQTGAIAVLTVPGNAGRMGLFAGIDALRFERPVIAGETLDLRCEVVALRSGVGRGRVQASVDGAPVCSGELIFAFADPGSPAADGSATGDPGSVRCRVRRLLIAPWSRGAGQGLVWISSDQALSVDGVASTT